MNFMVIKSMCYNDYVNIKNVLPLLCVSDGVFPAAAPPAPLYQHGVREWGFPRLKVKRSEADVGGSLQSPGGAGGTQT